MSYRVRQSHIPTTWRCRLAASAKNLSVGHHYEESMTDTDGAAAFIRRYAKTWVHAVATAAMTAFGTLTVIDTRFAALALAAYILPPVILYLRRDTGTEPPEQDSKTDEQVSDSDTGHTTGDDETVKPGTWTTAPVPTEVALHDAAIGPTRRFRPGSGVGGAWVTYTTPR